MRMNKCDGCGAIAPSPAPSGSRHYDTMNKGWAFLQINLATNKPEGSIVSSGLDLCASCAEIAISALGCAEKIKADFKRCEDERMTMIGRMP